MPLTLEQEAAAVLLTGDWIKHRTLMIRPDGSCGMCLVGALRFAFNNTWQPQASLLAKTEHVSSSAPNYADYDEAIERVAERIYDRDPSFHPAAGEDALMTFNDAEDTGFVDVLAVLTG